MHIGKTVNRCALFASVALGAMWSPAAFAADQAAPAAASAETAGDIVVTARRREESIQNVPLSITAVSGDTLRAKQINTAMDLGKLAPGLTVSPSFRGSNTPYFVIRGQRLIDTSAVLDPVTIVYVNDVPFMRPQGVNGALFDVQNVQILRGPQGTLFGRNSTGGAVLINTNPAVDRFEGNVGVTLGSFARTSADGAINIPLSDTLAVRVAAVYSRRDGYMIDRRTGWDANDENYNAQRVTLTWKPTDTFKTTFYGNRFWSENHGFATQLYGVAGATAPNNPVYTSEIPLNLASPHTYTNSLNPQESTRTWDVTNVSSLEAGDHLTIKNIVSYRHLRTRSVSDIDGTYYVSQNNEGRTEGDQFSEELQLQGTSSNFDWIVGAFYFWEKANDYTLSSTSNTPATGKTSGVLNVRNTSLSGFVSGTYRFGIEGLSLSAGARITHDVRKADGFQGNVNLPSETLFSCNYTDINNVTIQPPCLTPQRASFTKPSYSITLNYQVNPDLMVYAAHRLGYKSGGVQNRVQKEAAKVSFQPETVNDFELGVKYGFNTGDLRGHFNLDGFYAKYKNLQRQISFPGTGNVLISGIFNAASSTVKGLEGDFLLEYKGLELSGSAGYVDPKYDRFDSYTAAGAPPTDISYWGFAFVPKWTVNGEVAYNLPLDEKMGKVRVSLSGRYQSEMITSDTPTAQPYTLPGFTVFDARVAWADVGGSPVSLAVTATNLFDKAYATYATNVLGSLGTTARNMAPPRMIAAEARVKF